MTLDVEEQLTDVEVRLGETLCAFAVFKILNERADKESDASLNAKIQVHGQFWQATLVGQQTVHILGIGALVDKRPDVASLVSVLKLVRSKLPDDIATDIESRLTAMKTKYSDYRHKLFGHTAIDRRAIIDKFNAEEFTLEEHAADLADLEYVFKLLFQASRGSPLPTVASAKKMHFPYRQSVERTEADTHALLTAL